MGNMCSCLCPKRKNNKTSYDVHQQTFQMEEQIDSMHIDQTSPPMIVNSHQTILSDEPSTQNRQSHIIIKDNSLQNYQENYSKQEQKRYFEQKNKSDLKKQEKQDQFSLQQQEIDSAKDIRSSQPLIQSRQAISTSPIAVQPLVQVIPIIQQKEQIKPANPNILKPKTIKKKYNPDDYRFKDEQNSFKVKIIDSIKCQQFNIDNCKYSQYFIFDVTANVYIDDTNDTKIYIAPCQSTIFIRNCRNLTIIAATKQFRTYQCHNCTFSLLCKSQPVIQSSSQLTFVPFQIHPYEYLRDQMNQVKLQFWNNHWSQIHNFTKKVNQQHHYLRRQLKQNEQLNWSQAFIDANIQPSKQMIIPFIQGELEYNKNNQNQIKLIVIFNSDMTKKSDSIIEVIKNFKILKSIQGKIPNYGKDQRVVLLLLSNSINQQNNFINQQIQKLKVIAQIFTQKEQVQKYETQLFVNFGDQREK